MNNSIQIEVQLINFWDWRVTKILTVMLLLFLLLLCSCNRNKIKSGDTVIFGVHEWIVLTVEKNKTLIITKNIIEERAYDYSGNLMSSEFPPWDQSSL